MNASTEFDGQMSTVERFFAALRKRRISIKEAALLGNSHPINLTRLKSGLTAKLDAETIKSLASRLPDGDRFICEVFEIGDATERYQNSRVTISRDASPSSREERRQLKSIWFDSSGKSYPSSDSLASSISGLFDIAGADKHTSIDLTCRKEGWVGIEVSYFDFTIFYDPASIAAPAALQAINWIEGSSISSGVVECFAERMVHSSSLEIVSALRRRIRARQPRPKDFSVHDMPVTETPKELRKLLKYASESGLNSPLLALTESGRIDAASIYSIIDGEAICWHVGADYSIATAKYAGMRVLDRPTFIDFASLIDQNVVVTAAQQRPAAQRVKVCLGSRKYDYIRLSLPFYNNHRSFVVTSSVVLSDTESP